MFKFGLQAWLLLGIAGACGALLQWARRPRFKWPAAAAFALPPLLCTATVLWQRVVVAAPRDASGAVALSLNAAAQLPPSDQSAINWLVHHAGPDDSVVEATGDQAYSQFARISSLSGVATPLGWAQHVAGWGAPDSLISARRRAIDCVYAWPGDGTPLSALHALHARYVFVGDLERQTYNAAALARLREALPVAFSQGDTFIARVP